LIGEHNGLIFLMQLAFLFIASVLVSKETVMHKRLFMKMSNV